MKKRLIFYILPLIFCILLTGCSFPHVNLPFNSNIDNESGISYTAYDRAYSQDDILEHLLNTMENNQSVCYFNIPNEDMINADAWLAALPGIESINCKYLNINNGYNVLVTLKYWDNYAIVNAFRTGNVSSLTDMQLELYNKYCDILNMYTSPSSTQWDNELAIHDYLVNNIEYIREGDYVFNAYDALINGRSVCSGYAECFKTFMDMLGIESTTISGTANGESHIWNLAKLGGDWYHVDVTWDDPIGNIGCANHEYFNITDEDIAIDHAWDSTLYSAAAGTRYSYANIMGLTSIRSQAELDRYIMQTLNSQIESVEFVVYNDIDLKAALSNANISLSYSYKITERNTYSLYSLRFTYE